jgi:hypothetical protein
MAGQKSSKRNPSRRGKGRGAAATCGRHGRVAGAARRAQVTIRHFCQGIGDCHLLKFPNDDGSDFFMLIDCGVHPSVTGGRRTIAKIVDDIASVTKKIDVLVVTHEHWDHVSGFLTAEKNFSPITVGEVWMAWTEDPHDDQAHELDKFKQQALKALQATSQRLKGVGGLSQHLSAIRDGLLGLLGFQFGAKGERVRDARDKAAKMATAGVKYFEPTDPPISVAGLSNVRIYVLGPPRDATMLGITDKASEMYGLSGKGGWPMARALTGAFPMGDGTPVQDEAAPFDSSVGTDLKSVLDPAAKPGADLSKRIIEFVREHYAGPTNGNSAADSRPKNGKSDHHEADQSWRRIDDDWLGIGADLAIQLDDRTNNSSLVLAFEFIDTQRVILFAADAQVGNWLSWQDVKWRVPDADSRREDTTITGPDLVARTVYYKVGHHGSHNATLRQNGLELMVSKDLAAFIPTNEKDAQNVGWGEMPFKKMLEVLQKQTSGRVIRADDEWVSTSTVPPLFQQPTGAIREVRHEPGLWVELDIA